MIITDEQRSLIIKEQIKTEAGWNRIIFSIINSSDPSFSLSECKKHLRMIGDEYQKLENYNGDINMSDELVQQLEDYISKSFEEKV